MAESCPSTPECRAHRATTLQPLIQQPEDDFLEVGEEFVFDDDSFFIVTSDNAVLPFDFKAGVVEGAGDKLLTEALLDVINFSNL